jgi:hypothetical protein
VTEARDVRVTVPYATLRNEHRLRHIHVKIKITVYVSGYTETDTTGMFSLPTVWRFSVAAYINSNIFYFHFLIWSLSRLLCCVVSGSNVAVDLAGAQDSHLQTVTIPEAAYTKLRRRPPEDEQSNARNM